MLTGRLRFFRLRARSDIGKLDRAAIVDSRGQGHAQHGHDHIASAGDVINLAWTVWENVSPAVAPAQSHAIPVQGDNADIEIKTLEDLPGRAQGVFGESRVRPTAKPASSRLGVKLLQPVYLVQSPPRVGSARTGIPLERASESAGPKAQGCKPLVVIANEYAAPIPSSGTAPPQAASPRFPT